MAAVNDSSDESEAPEDFHLSSSLDSDSFFSFNIEICPLCNNVRKRFHCKQCIRNGDFMCSITTDSERFSEKQLRLQSLRNSKQLVQEKCEKLLKKKINYDHLISEIKQCNQRIVYLRKLIDATKKRKITVNEQLGQIKKKNHELKMQLPHYRDRVIWAENKIEYEFRPKVAAAKKQIDECLKELKKLTHDHIEKLIKYIFPLSEVLPTQPQSSVKSTLNSRSNDSGIEIFVEAQKTVYISEQWSQLLDHETSGGISYRIIAPTLPGSGDFSNYNDRAASQEDSVDTMLNVFGEGCVSKIEHNVAFTTSAALTYTAQLVNVLAFYLDVRLPYKMKFSDFCSSDYISGRKFARRVARLNSNILNLCFSQSVNPYLLRPSAPIHNILCLINPELSDLGRRGPVEIDPKGTFILEQQLSRALEYSEDSESDEDILPWEWEFVPHVQRPAVGILTMGSQHDGVAGGSQDSSVAGGLQDSGVTGGSQNSTDDITSIAGDLMTSAAASIASVWRGWKQLMANT